MENTSYSFIVDYGTPILDEERHGLGILYKKLPKDIIGIFSKETVKNFYCKEALEEEWGLSGLDYKATYEKELCYVFRKKNGQYGWYKPYANEPSYYYDEDGEVHKV